MSAARHGALTRHARLGRRGRIVLDEDAERVGVHLRAVWRAPWSIWLASGLRGSPGATDKEVRSSVSRRASRAGVGAPCRMCRTGQHPAPQSGVGAMSRRRTSAPQPACLLDLGAVLQAPAEEAWWRHAARRLALECGAPHGGRPRDVQLQPRRIEPAGRLAEGKIWWRCNSFEASVCERGGGRGGSSHYLM